MKNKTKKFTVIIAAICIAALCVFSITFRNGGVSAHAAASAGVQEQATQGENEILATDSKFVTRISTTAGVLESRAVYSEATTELEN